MQCRMQRMRVLTYSFCLVLTGRLATTIAANMTAQPMTSRSESISPRMIIPAMRANTDSRHSSIAAMAGSVYFCPMTWTQSTKLPLGFKIALNVFPSSDTSNTASPCFNTSSESGSAIT